MTAVPAGAFDLFREILGGMANGVAVTDRIARWRRGVNRRAGRS